MSVDIMYNQEIDEKKRKRRAITCPSHNPIIVSKNQSAPEKKTNPRKKKRNPLQLLAALAGLGSLLGEKVWKWC
jgi:hypothetical protein